MMIAGFERDDDCVKRPEIAVVARFGDGKGFGVRCSGTLVGGNGEHVSGGIEQHTANRRIGCCCALKAARRRKGLAHGNSQAGFGNRRCLGLIHGSLLFTSSTLNRAMTENDTCPQGGMVLPSSVLFHPDYTVGPGITPGLLTLPGAFGTWKPLAGFWV